MTFTDDDLTRLKEDIHKNKTRTGIRFNLHYPTKTLEALVARLEAAEWACKRADALGECIAEFPKETYAWSEHMQALDDAVEAWRKAAGK